MPPRRRGSIATQPTPSATYDRLDARNAGNDVGRHHDAARIPGGRCQRGHQGARAGPRAPRLGPAGDGRRGLHDEPRAGGARPRVARSPAAVGRHRARDRREQRVCERVHRRRRPAGRARHGGRDSARWSGVPSSTCWSPRRASSASRSTSTRFGAACRPP